jgi:hypothetical protein
MAISLIETASLDTGLVAPTATALTTASGSAPSYSARAWVNFNGTGTVAIRASGNVSSITDNGTGDYTVNFTTAMPDANYCATPNNHGQSDHIFVGGVVTYAAGSVRMYFGTTGAVGAAANTRVDAANYGVSIFR